jgi:hypothetical protein
MFKKASYSTVLARSIVLVRQLLKCSSAAERLKEDSRGLSFHANDAGGCAPDVGCDTRNRKR